MHRLLATPPDRTDVSRRVQPKVFYGWWVTAALAVTQTVGYGVLYYAFAVFLGPMQRDLHATTTQIAGALTLAVLISGLAAPPIGRWLDRHGGRGLMTGGSILGTLAVLGWSQVDDLPGLYAAMAVLGLASAMVFYEPAIAVLVGWFDAPRRATALLTVTVVAGFASTIFLPLTGILVEAYGWRIALLVLAAIHGTITIPLHALVVRRPPQPETQPGKTRNDRANSAVRGAVRDRPFWLLGAAFVAQIAATATIVVHLVVYLTTLGHSGTFAAAVAGLLGVLSVTGRLVTTGLQRRWPVAIVTGTVFAVQSLAAAALPFLGPSSAGAIVCVLLFGFGFGVATLARPALLSQDYDTAAYGTLSGALALPITITKAVAPLVAATLALASSYTAVMLAAATCCAIAAACLLAHRRTTSHPPATGPASGTRSLMA